MKENELDAVKNSSLYGYAYEKWTEGSSSGLRATVQTTYFWINKLKCCRTWTENEARSGRPIEVTKNAI